MQKNCNSVVVKVVKINLLVYTAIFCVSCAGSPSNNGQNNQNQGILVTELHSNFNDISLSLIHEDGESVSSAIFGLNPNDNFRVLSLPSGRYTWKSIKVGQWRTNIKDDFSFVIKKGTLNYIGDVLLKVDGEDVRISFINKSGAIRSRLQQDYSGLYDKYPYEVNITKTEEY